MKRKWLVYPVLMFAVAAFGVVGSAKEKLIESRWAAAPIKIDGLAQDWQDATFLTDPDSKAQYALDNDANNLYILVLFKDGTSASTINYTGMKIFFNADGRKSKDLGIHFSKKQVTPEELISSLERKSEVLTEERKAEIRKQKFHYLFVADTINTKKEAAPPDPAVQTEPPVFAARSQGRTLICEFRIPLSRVNESGGIGTQPGKTIQVGFEWGGMTSQFMKDMMAGKVAQGIMVDNNLGIDEGMGFEIDTADTQPSSGDYRRDPRSRLHSFWVAVKLAAPPSPKV